MFAERVESQFLQELQIIYHAFQRRRHIDTIRPESLVQGAKHEDEFTVQQWPHDSVDGTFGDSSEACVALNLVLAHGDGHIVQVRCIGRPQLWGGDVELEWLVGRAVVSGHCVSIVDHGDLDRAAGVRI